MDFIKKNANNIFLAGTCVVMLTTLAWDWSNIKSFISGGVIAVCLTLKVIR